MDESSFEGGRFHPLDENEWQKRGFTILDIARAAGVSDREIKRTAERWQQGWFLEGDGRRMDAIMRFLENYPAPQNEDPTALLE